MALLVKQDISRTPLNPTLSACDVAGDKFINTGIEFLLIRNLNAAARTVTVDVPVLVDGLAVTDLSFSVPAGQMRIIGPFTKAIYNNASNELNITYSAVADLTIAVLAIPTTSFS